MQESLNGTSQTGPRQLRALSRFVLAMFVLVLSAALGCEPTQNNSNAEKEVPSGSHPEQEAEEESCKPKPAPDASVLASMTTQTNCDISTFFLLIRGLELRLENGDYVNVLDVPMKVDLARLDARIVEQAFAISDLPGGSYTGARLTIDFSQSLAVLFNHDDMSGNQAPATLVDSLGKPLIGMRQITIKVHGDTLTIAPGKLGHLRLIANLAASAIADPVANTLEWNPVFEAEFDPPRLRRLFAKALLLDVCVVNHQFSFALMSATEDAGQVATTTTKESTVYQLVPGNFGLAPFVGQGAAALNVMDDFPVGTPLLIDLRISKYGGTLLAKCVNAGLGVETASETFVYGYVLDRDTLCNPTLLVHAILAYTPEHGYRYNIQLEVEVDSLTIPVLGECENKVGNSDWLNVGTKVVLFGEMEVQQYYGNVCYQQLLMSNKYCKIDALARVLPVMLCGKLLSDIDYCDAKLQMKFCKLDCLDACYFAFACAGINPDCLWIGTNSLSACKCDKKGDCVCVYVFFRSYKHTLDECTYGKRKAKALDIFCPCDTLIVQNPRNVGCTAVTWINDCDILLNLLATIHATLYPCNPCADPKELHTCLSDILASLLPCTDKYFSLYRDGVVDQFLHKKDFLAELLRRHLLKDINVFRFWAYGIFDKKIKVFFCKHIVIIDDNKGPVTPPDDGDEDEGAPNVAFTFPQDGATNVPINTAIVIGFDEPMNPDTINESTIIVTANGTPITGTVTYDENSNVATFTPDDDLPASTVITVTVTTGVEDVAGNPMETPYEFEFETGTEADTTAPTVISEYPADGATEVPINTIVAAGFSEPMNPDTINESTFLLETNGTPVTGTVTWSGTTATFTPDTDLEPNTTYTATITTGATDLAGNPIESDHTWSFTTNATQAQGPDPVFLGTACNFTALAKTGISTTGQTTIMGDIGLSPAAGSFFTGFTNHTLQGPYSTSDEVDGQMFAADYDPPTPTMLTVAILDMEAAYTDAATRPNPDFIELGGGNLEGMTLAPGLYKWSTGVNIPTQLTLDGGPDDVWIFQIAGDLVLGTDATVTMQGGASAENVFWQVAGQAILGVGSELHGIVLSQTAIILQTGATLHGGAYAQSAITLDTANLTGK